MSVYWLADEGFANSYDSCNIDYIPIDLAKLLYLDGLGFSSNMINNIFSTRANLTWLSERNTTSTGVNPIDLAN